MLSTFVLSKLPRQYCRSRCQSVRYHIVLRFPHVVQSDDVGSTFEETKNVKLGEDALKSCYLETRCALLVAPSRSGPHHTQASGGSVEIVLRVENEGSVDNLHMRRCRAPVVSQHLQESHRWIIPGIDIDGDAFPCVRKVVPVEQRRNKHWNAPHAGAGGACHRFRRLRLHTTQNGASSSHHIHWVRILTKILL